MSQADNGNAENIPPQPTDANGGTGKGCLIAAVLLACVVFALLGGVYLVEIPFAIALGWGFYLFRVVPQVALSADGMAMFALSLVLLAIGTHFAARWWIGRSSTNDNAPDWSTGQTARLVTLVCLTFIAGIGITGVVHQTGWLITSPEPIVESSFYHAAQRTGARNNLHQIGIGVANYVDRRERFPQGVVTTDGRVLHSWQTVVLSYMGVPNFYTEIDFNRHWRDPVHRRAFQWRVEEFVNPAIDGHDQTADGYGASHVAANIRVINVDRICRLEDITDGESSTILCGEVVTEFRAWGDPLNVRDPMLGINQHPDGFGGPWEGGMHVLFADGSTRFINAKIDPTILRALATPDAGDVVSEF